MKRFMQVMVMAILVSVFATACGQDEANKETKATNDKDTVTAEKADNVKKNQESEELTAEEIIKKSSEVMNEWPGMDINITGKTKIDATQGDDKQSMTQNMDMQTKVKNDPLAMEITGKVSVAGQEMPMNSYYKDKTLYQEAPGQGWMAIKGMDLESLQQNSQAQDPSKQMQQFADLVKDLKDKDKYVKKSEEDGMYIITLDLNKEALAMVKEQAQEIMSESMGEQMQQMGGDMLDQMEYKRMHIVFNIDKDTFEQKKMNQQITISMDQEDAQMTIDADITLDSIKKFDGDIEIPDDVKKDAQEVSMDQLQEAAEQQGQ